MESVRDILNEIKWRFNKSLKDTEIYYIHRGAPGDFKTIKGDEISDLGRSFITCGEGHIPYHRVFKIEYEEEVIFEREKR